MVWILIFPRLFLRSGANRRNMCLLIRHRNARRAKNDGKLKKVELKIIECEIWFALIFLISLYIVRHLVYNNNGFQFLSPPARLLTAGSWRRSHWSESYRQFEWNLNIFCSLLARCAGRTEEKSESRNRGHEREMSLSWRALFSLIIRSRSIINENSWHWTAALSACSCHHNGVAINRHSAETVESGKWLASEDKKRTLNSGLHFHEKKVWTRDERQGDQRNTLEPWNCWKIVRNGYKAIRRAFFSSTHRRRLKSCRFFLFNFETEPVQHFLALSRAHSPPRVQKTRSNRKWRRKNAANVRCNRRARWESNLEWWRKMRWRHNKYIQTITLAVAAAAAGVASWTSTSVDASSRIELSLRPEKLYFAGVSSRRVWAPSAAIYLISLINFACIAEINRISCLHRDSIWLLSLSSSPSPACQSSQERNRRQSRSEFRIFI